MAALKLSIVNPAVVKIPSSNFHASGSRLIRPPHNVFMPSTTIHFPSVVLKRREPLAIKCCFTNSSSSNSVNRNTFVETNTKENPLELVAKSIAKALEALRKPATAALVVALLLLLNPNLAALAASGGRMGGSAFSNRSSSSPSSSSYKSSSSPSWSSSSSSSYKSSSSSSSSYSRPSSPSPSRSSSSSSSSYYSRPSSPSPSRSSSSSSSYTRPSSPPPVRYSSSSSSSYSRPSIANSLERMKKLEHRLDQMIKDSTLGELDIADTPENYIKNLEHRIDQMVKDIRAEPDVADALDKYNDNFDNYLRQNCNTKNQYNARQRSRAKDDAPSPSKKSRFFTTTIIAIISALVLIAAIGSESPSVRDAEKTSVLKLQIGLLGLAKSLQKDLNRIAETADTSTPEGLHYVLTETTVGLLRHSSYWISTHSSFDVESSMDGGEKRFNELSIEERAKFDEETLVNVNTIKTRCSKTVKGDGSSNKYIVLTILVAVGGLHKLPTIYNSEDLKGALQKLASIPLSRTLAVEVLWTPQKENDTLSEKELLEDYPMLRPL